MIKTLLISAHTHSYLLHEGIVCFVIFLPECQLNTVFQTVKTEPLDYPGEVVWSEGAGGLGREASGVDDSQALLPISAAMHGGLEGVAAAIVASPNLPIIEFGRSCLYTA